MLLYERAVALNRERHQNLRMEPLPGHFAFAANTNAILLASSEIADASRDYPIAFAGAEGGPFALAALVGLRDRENLLVDADGLWEPNTYVPAFARHYPFVLAESTQDAVLTVCIDEAYAGLNETRGEPLFEANGEESTYLKGVVEFMGAFHADMQRTREFAARLQELGLLVSKAVTVKQPESGESDLQVLNGVWVVDEEKLRAADDSVVLEMFRRGYMGWIYAHLLSIRNLQRLAARFDRASNADRRGAEGGAERMVPRTPVPRWNGSERRKKPR